MADEAAAAAAAAGAGAAARAAVPTELRSLAHLAAVVLVRPTTSTSIWVVSSAFRLATTRNNTIAGSRRRAGHTGGYWLLPAGCGLPMLITALTTTAAATLVVGTGGLGGRGAEPCLDVANEVHPADPMRVRLRDEVHVRVLTQPAFHLS